MNLKMSILMTMVSLVLGTRSFAQSPLAADMEYGLACIKDDFHCEKIKVSNFKVYNLGKTSENWNGSPIQITFDVVEGVDFVGATKISLPLESESIKGSCNLSKSGNKTSRSEIYNSGNYLLDRETQWGSLSTEEFLKFHIVQFRVDEAAKIEVSYSHTILCSPKTVNANKISFRFSGKIK